MGSWKRDKSEATAFALKLEPPALPGTMRKGAWSNRQSAFHRYAVVVIFGVACTLLMLFIVAQQRVIDSQRTLIRQLFHDSQELNDMKVQNLQHAKPHSK